MTLKILLTYAFLCCYMLTGSVQATPRIIPADERTDAYFPLLKGKRIALFSNHTGMVGNRHLLDILIENRFNVTAIFSPEHGFRGNAGAGEQVAFDIFRFDENGKIAEHWDNLAAKAEPNPSGRTQIDGTMELKDLDKTEANREVVKNFLYDVMQGNRPEKTPDYFDGDTYIQHNTGIADGLSGLGAALAAMAEQNIQMIYNTVHQVLAQGNFVLAVSEGTFGGAPTSYYDLWRVEDGKIAEHWDVMETIADKSTWQNQNGKF